MIAIEISDLKPGKAVRSNSNPTKIVKDLKTYLLYLYATTIIGLCQM